jgi:hypothetical protein
VWARVPSSGWDRYPNLQLRPHAPNAGRGRLQRQIARAFIGHPLRSTGEIYDWCYARDRSRTRSEAMRWSVHRILREIADPICRVPPHGAIIWRIKTPAAEHSPPRQIEIIGEIATWPTLPILQTMFAARTGER